MVVTASTVYDADVNYHWQNANDRVAYQREFEQGDFEDKQCAWALLTANPQTPKIEIRENLNQPMSPDRFGYDNDQLTITDIIKGRIADSRSHVADYHTTDFSGKVSGKESSEVPSLPLW